MFFEIAVSFFVPFKTKKGEETDLPRKSNKAEPSLRKQRTRGFMSTERQDPRVKQQKEHYDSGSLPSVLWSVVGADTPKNSGDGIGSPKRQISASHKKSGEAPDRKESDLSFLKALGTLPRDMEGGRDTLPTRKMNLGTARDLVTCSGTFSEIERSVKAKQSKLSENNLMNKKKKKDRLRGSVERFVVIEKRRQSRKASNASMNAESAAVVNQLKQFFEGFDKTMAKKFITKYTKILKENGRSEMNALLKKKYDQSLDEFLEKNAEKAKHASKNATQVKTNNAELLRTSLATVIKQDIGSSTSNEELSKALQGLLRLRHDRLNCEVDPSDIEGHVKDILKWCFSNGCSLLVAKLSYFYLDEETADFKRSETVADVPYHELSIYQKVREKLQKTEPTPSQLKRITAGKRSETDGKQRIVHLDDDTVLDQNEIGYLWFHVYKFYEDNNFSKGKVIDLVKQTENSVYYILQNGIEGFNDKLAQRYGSKLSQANFDLPVVQTESNAEVFKFIRECYQQANEQLTEVPEKGEDKVVGRSFNKLIDALNFKFQAGKPKTPNQKKEKKVTSSYSNAKLMKKVSKSISKSKFQFSFSIYCLVHCFHDAVL